MTDQSDDKPAATADAAKRALAMKQAAAKGAAQAFRGGRGSERAAAARSASKSKPAMRK
jgi:hypothetical protein